MAKTAYFPFINVAVADWEDAVRLVDERARELGGRDARDLADRCVAALARILPAIWKAPGNVLTERQLRLRCGVREGKAWQRMREVLATVLEFVPEVGTTWGLVAKQYARVAKQYHETTKPAAIASQAEPKTFRSGKRIQAVRAARDRRECGINPGLDAAKPLETQGCAVENQHHRVYISNSSALSPRRRVKSGKLTPAHLAELERVRRHMAAPPDRA